MKKVCQTAGVTAGGEAVEVWSRSSRRTRYIIRNFPSRCCGGARRTATARYIHFRSDRNSPLRLSDAGAAPLCPKFYLRAPRRTR